MSPTDPASPSHPSAPPPRNGRRLLISLVLVLICLGMARLQWWRAETRGAEYERQQVQAQAAPIALDAGQRDAAALAWRSVSARGRFLAERTIFLDNKVYRQHPGYHVLTPLRLSGAQAVVLVNRGWIPAPRLRSEIPAVATPGGEIEIHGIARPYPTRGFALGDTQPQGLLWQQIREADYRQRSGLDTLPIIVLQQGTAIDDGLVRDWSDIGGPDNPARRHHGYALMWLVFAVMALGYGAIIWRRAE